MHQELFYFFIEKVFASDPWHLAQPGSIRNLTIQTKGSKEIVNKKHLVQVGKTLQIVKLISGLNALQIMTEGQSKKIKELKEEVDAVRLKGLLTNNHDWLFFGRPGSDRKASTWPCQKHWSPQGGAGQGKKCRWREMIFFQSFHFHCSFLWLGAESMQKMERRFSKTLLTMSKKFLSLEGDIENISCEGTVEYKNNTYHVQIIVSQWALHTYHSILLKDLRHPQPHPQAERRRMRKTQKYPGDQEF